MDSLKKLFKIGHGPSSSHTMGPSFASEIFKSKYPNATSYSVTLYGSLALTGIGHLIDKAIYDVLNKDLTTIIYKPDEFKEYHPNGMMFEAFNNNELLGSWIVYSIGGGDLKEENELETINSYKTYPHNTMNEVLSYCKENDLNLVEYVLNFEDESFIDFMNKVYEQMKSSAYLGMQTDGLLPGKLNVTRRSSSFYNEYLTNPSLDKIIYAASLGVSEVNASGGIVVTSPTCGSSGVVPGILMGYELFNKYSKEKLIEGLMVAGLVGNIVKTNGSISGAEVGCQGEVGVACAMASAMVAYLENSSNEVIEYASEIALEHHLGMTCDPIDGMVQIPCIERNAIASMQAYNSAHYAMLTNGIHHISFDKVIDVMMKTGKDLQAAYKETSLGGLAAK